MTGKHIFAIFLMLIGIVGSLISEIYKNYFHFGLFIVIFAFGIFGISGSYNDNHKETNSPVIIQKKSKKTTDWKLVRKQIIVSIVLGIIFSLGIIGLYIGNKKEWAILMFFSGFFIFIGCFPAMNYLYDKFD